MLGLEDLGIETLLQLEADPTDQSLDQFLARVRRHYALSGVAYYCASFRGRSLADPFVALSCREASLDDSQALYKTIFEPAFSIGAHSLLPIDWARLGRPAWKGVSANKGRQGLTISVRGPANGVWALFSVASDESDREWWRRRCERIKDLMHVAHYVHQRACDLNDDDAPVDLNAITSREIEALECLAQAKNSAEIAIQMRISLATVNGYLDSARFKLQALNRVHAVTKAIRAGSIARPSS
jgi:LuxR family quorum-sensing system transcriptional regulator SinR